MSVLNYEEDMKIDETALDVEWLEQSSLANKYNQEFAKISKDVALAEEEVKTVRSDLIKEAHANPKETCGVAKATAQQVEAYYRTHPDYKDVVAELIDLQYEKTMVELAKNEINFTRKTALEELGALLAQQYFSGPRSPRNLTKEANKRRQERGERVAKKIGKGMRRKKRQIKK